MPEVGGDSTRNEAVCPAGHEWMHTKDQHGCVLRVCLLCEKDGKTLVDFAGCKKFKKAKKVRARGG